MPIPPPVLPQIQTPNLAAAYLQGLQLKNQMQAAQIAQQNAAFDRQMKIAEFGLKGEELGIKRSKLKADERTADAAMLTAETKAAEEQRKSKVFDAVQGALTAMDPNSQTGGTGPDDPMSYLHTGARLAKIGAVDKDVRGAATLYTNLGKAMVTLKGEQREQLKVESQKIARSILSGNQSIDGISPEIADMLGGAGITDENGDGIIDKPTDPAIRSILFNLAGGSDPTPAGYQETAGGLEPRPGGPATKVPVEAASKTQMMATAKEQLPLVKSLTFNKDGSMNMKNISAAYVNFPKSDGRRLRTAMEVGIQAITRAETGAAMPPEEVENTRLRFMPNPLDDNKTAKLKVKMFEEFVTGNLKLLDHAGNFKADAFEQTLKKRGGEVNPPEKVINFEDLPE